MLDIMRRAGNNSSEEALGLMELQMMFSHRVEITTICNLLINYRYYQKHFACMHCLI